MKLSLLNRTHPRTRTSVILKIPFVKLWGPQVTFSGVSMYTNVPNDNRNLFWDLSRSTTIRESNIAEIIAIAGQPILIFTYRVLVVDADSCNDIK